MQNAPYVPYWLLILFPELRGLETNPLYIRWTNQGFGKRSAFWRFRFPKDMAPNWLETAGRFGWLPFVLMFSFFPLAILTDVFPLLEAIVGWGIWLFTPFGFYLLFARLFVPRGGPCMDYFIRQARTSGAGEMLLLTSLRAEDYGRALFAMLLRWQILHLGILFGILMFLLLLPFSFLGGDPNFLDLYLSQVLLRAVAIFIEITMISLIELSLGLHRQAYKTPRAKEARRELLPLHAFTACLAYFAAHAVGVCLYLTVMSGMSPRAYFGSEPFIFIVAILFNVPFVLMVCRWLFMHFISTPGEALAAVIRG